jgi:hypothetical protein
MDRIENDASNNSSLQRERLYRVVTNDRGIHTQTYILSLTRNGPLQNWRIQHFCCCVYSLPRESVYRAVAYHREEGYTLPSRWLAPTGGYAFQSRCLAKTGWIHTDWWAEFINAPLKLAQLPWYTYQDCFRHPKVDGGEEKETHRPHTHTHSTEVA